MKNRLKVVLYAGMYKKNQDGATKSLYKLTDSLLNRNIEVKLLASSATPQKRDGLIITKVIGVPFFFYHDYKFSFPLPNSKKDLDKYKPDIIHIAAPDLLGIFLARYARKNNIPLFMSYHTNFPSYLKYYKIKFLLKFGWWYFHWFYNHADIVFVPTQIVQNELSDKGIKNTKIWSRGVNTNQFNPSKRSNKIRSEWGADGKKVILYSGRFVWYKSLRSFIEIYNLFNEKYPKNVIFVLLGSGPIEDELKKKMPEAIFPGYLSGNDLSVIYASSDILCFPSTTETFGMVILESLSSGVPVVVSDIGGCQEIVINSGAGLVAKAGDADDFYNCCKKIITDKNLWESLRNNALNYSKNRNWENINNVVISEYYKTINGNG